MPTKRLRFKLNPKTKIKKRNWLISLTKATSFIGISLFLFGGLWLLYQKTVLSFASIPSTYLSASPLSIPTQISFDTPKLNLNIKEAAIRNNIWQTYTDAASHSLVSASPGEGSNIVIYAHNKKNLFGPLLWVTPNTKITLTTADGQVHHYQVSSIQTVSPDKIDVVMPTDEEVLTLYTCTGFLDSQRLVVKANPVK